MNFQPQQKHIQTQISTAGNTSGAEMSILDMCSIIWKRRLPIGLFAVLVAFVTFCYLHFISTPQYRAVLSFHGENIAKQVPEIDRPTADALYRMASAPEVEEQFRAALKERDWQIPVVSFGRPGGDRRIEVVFTGTSPDNLTATAELWREAFSDYFRKDIVAKLRYALRTDILKIDYSISEIQFVIEKLSNERSEISARAAGKISEAELLPLGEKIVELETDLAQKTHFRAYKNDAITMLDKNPALLDAQSSSIVERYLAAFFTAQDQLKFSPPRVKPLASRAMTKILLAFIIAFGLAAGLALLVEQVKRDLPR